MQVRTYCIYIPQYILSGVPSLFELALKVLMTNINGKNH